MADFCNQSECIIQDLHSELKDMQEIRIYHGCEGKAEQELSEDSAAC